VRVPDLVDEPRGAVAEILSAAGLELGGVSGTGEVVRRQNPLAGTEVPAGSQVDVTTGPAPTTLVTVPDLLGADLESVPALLASRGLVLGLVTGGGDVVRDQEPAPGTRVPVDSAVNVSVEEAVPPATLVEVPDLLGRTGDEARAVVETAALVLGGELDGDERVGTQVPVAGTLVVVGSTVTVSASTERSAGWPWRAATLVGGLLLAVLLVRGSLRPWRDRRWVRRHLRVVARGAPGQGPAVTEPLDHASRPTQVVRLEPDIELGTPTLQEVDR
jgi:beta-lactam-binding protein with PASTA domain